jgi:hypothetical protein
MSDDCFERFSNVIVFLILEKSHVDLFGEREVEPAAFQVLAEVLFQSTDLRYK